MGWGDAINKIKERNKKILKDKVDKIKSEQIAKGLTVEEYVDAKNNGTLNSLPIVNNNNTNNTNTSNTTNNTPLYIGIGAVVLVAVYLVIKRKK